MTTTHQDFLVFAGDDAVNGLMSTTYGPYNPVNGTGDFLIEPRGYEEPPPPVSPKTIPLPALADIPVSVNPMLSYTPSKVVLEYNLNFPPSTARILPTTTTDDAPRDWRQQPAMDPSTVGSMTIMVPGLERFVVVFPATSDSDIVTVDDVLIAVHRAVQASATGSSMEYGIPGSSPMIIAPWTAYERTNIDAEECGGGDQWWEGLYPCQKERDVWVLRTTKVSASNSHLYNLSY
ncbi:hypothetical protein M413DRAFT_447632 [Hebeloma cylindrosporum]|uniref:DUF6699 domain-containing protein n=1 Tax=Hebeloma cylindrosporum TaxID=76867 RepID=A0A0C3BPW9_HEBCY|nr:hypothetical protein M413DRAFT_447632 [Hebeloma cylindrosporum h7]